MNVLILGSGAREHAIAWKLRQSSKLDTLYVAPGNAGTAVVACNLPLAIPPFYTEQSEWEDYFALLTQICRKFSIDLVIPQTEEPLGKGIADSLEFEEIFVFGANQKGALLESSKVASQHFMEKFGIPHAKGIIVREFFGGIEIPERYKVVKADGLARGKGVKVCETKDEVKQALRAALVDGDFGPAGETVVVQEKLQGREVSVQAFCDGTNLAFMPLVRDYKRVGEGDTGENSGSVGSYTNPSWVQSKDETEMEQITQGTVSVIDNLNKRSLPLRLFDTKGVVYTAYFVTNDGPKVIEYNMRFGDPETQTVLVLLESDLLEIMQDCVARELDPRKIIWEEQFSVCVVLCSEGYPDEKKVKKGVPVYGLDQVPNNVLVFHAGTTVNEEGQIVTNGGRVLSVVAKGETLEEAKDKVYEAIKYIRFEGMFCRPDIAEYL